MAYRVSRNSVPLEQNKYDNYLSYSFLLNYSQLSISQSQCLSQSKFSGTRKFTLRYQQFELTGEKRSGKCAQTIFSDLRGYFEISIIKIIRDKN